METPQVCNTPSNSLHCTMNPHHASSQALSCPRSLITAWTVFQILLYTGFCQLLSPSPPFTYPPFPASHGPLLTLPLSTFLGEWVESSMVMWDPRRVAGLPLTRAQCECKSGASYPPVQSSSRQPSASEQSLRRSKEAETRLI